MLLSDKFVDPFVELLFNVHRTIHSVHWVLLLGPWTDFGQIRRLNANLIVNIIIMHI